MANICITNYWVKGEKETLQKIADAINDKNAVVEKTIPCWAGNTLAKLGIPHDGAGRCWWYDARIENGVLCFFEEGAWVRGDAIKILSNNLPDIDVVFLSEELGCGIYETNDTMHEFVEDTTYLDDEENGCIYASSVEDLLNIVSELYPDSKGCKDIDMLNDYFNENAINSTAHEVEYVGL